MIVNSYLVTAFAKHSSAGLGVNGTAVVTKKPGAYRMTRYEIDRHRFRNNNGGGENQHETNDLGSNRLVAHRRLSRDRTGLETLQAGGTGGGVVSRRL